MTLPDPTIDQSDSSQVDWSLIARYLANELSAEERQAFERAIAGDAIQQKRLLELRELWDQAGSLPSVSRLQAMWETVARRRDGVERRAKGDTPAIEPLAIDTSTAVVVPCDRDSDELATDLSRSSERGDRK